MYLHCRCHYSFIYRSLRVSQGSIASDHGGTLVIRGRSIGVIERDQRLPEAYRYFFPGSLSVRSNIPAGIDRIDHFVRDSRFHVSLILILRYVYSFSIFLFFFCVCVTQSISWNRTAYCEKR